MAVMQHVCMSGQQLGKVYYSLPLGLFFPPLPLLEALQPNRYNRGSRGGFGERSARQQMERASLKLHVSSRDLPWRALEEYKGQ